MTVDVLDVEIAGRFVALEAVFAFAGTRINRRVAELIRHSFLLRARLTRAQSTGAQFLVPEKALVGRDGAVVVYLVARLSKANYVMESIGVAVGRFVARIVRLRTLAAGLLLLEILLLGRRLPLVERLSLNKLFVIVIGLRLVLGIVAALNTIGLEELGGGARVGPNPDEVTAGHLQALSLGHHTLGSIEITEQEHDATC